MSTPLQTLLHLSLADAAVRRRFDGGFSGAHGLSLHDFLILVRLEAAPDGAMKRVDLANGLGLTASGVTRLLAPLEKIGLVQRTPSPGDARLALTALTATGRERVAEARASATRAAEDVCRDRFTADELATLDGLLARLVAQPLT